MPQRAQARALARALAAARVRAARARRRTAPGAAGAKGRARASRSASTARLKKVLSWFAIVSVVGTLVLVSIFYFAYRATDIPDPNEAFQAQTTNVYYSGGKAKIGRFATQNRESIPLADIPQAMQDAVVAAEDRTFWTNKGIDPKGILRAAFSNAKGDATQGASTITQQYVKILYLSQERTLKRKVKEAFLSLKMQQEQSKYDDPRGLPEHHLLRPWRLRRAGCANAYFGKPAKKLTVPESAMLAAVLNSPNYLSPDRGEAGGARCSSATTTCCAAMVSMGNLDATEADEFYGKLPKLAKAQTSNMYGGQRGFMLTMVKDELLRLGFDDAEIEAGGLRVETTFTRKAMEAAEDGVLAERPPGLKKLHVATASVDVKTGALLGFYGGQNYLQEPAELGGRSAAHRARRSSRSPSRPGSRTGSASRTPSTATRPTCCPSGGEVGNQGEGKGDELRLGDQPDHRDRELGQHRLRRPDHVDGGRPEKVIKMAIALGVPKNAPGLKPFPASRSARRRSARSTWPTPTRPSPTAASTTTGSWSRRSPAPRTTRCSTRAPKKPNRALSEDIAADVSYALQQVVQERHRAQRPRPRPARSRQDRHRDQRRRRRVLLLVRRLHPAGRHRRDVRARQGQRGAQRLPAHLLRR